MSIVCGNNHGSLRLCLFEKADIERHNTEAGRNKYGISRSDQLHCAHISTVVQAEGLKRGLERMVKVKTEKYETENIDARVQRACKQQEGSVVEIMALDPRRRGDKAYLDKVEIDEMLDEENEDDNAGVEHVLGKKGRFRPVSYDVRSLSCGSVLTGYQKTEKNMDQKA